MITENEIEAGKPTETTDFLPSDGAPCCASSDTPETDIIRREYSRLGVVAECALAKCAEFERTLGKFMAITETSDDGITQMATIEGRVKFYERLRTVRKEAHRIL